MTHLAINTFSSLHIVPNKGEMMIGGQKQVSENKWAGISELEPCASFQSHLARVRVMLLSMIWFVVFLKPLI